MNTSSHKQNRYTESAIQLIKKTDRLHDLYTLSTNHLRQLVNLNKHLWPKILSKLENMPHLRIYPTLYFLSAR